MYNTCSKIRQKAQFCSVLEQFWKKQYFLHTNMCKLNVNIKANMSHFCSLQILYARQSWISYRGQYDTPSQRGLVCFKFHCNQYLGESRVYLNCRPAAVTQMTHQLPYQLQRLQHVCRLKKVKAVARKAAIAAKRSERSLLKARDDGILNAMMALSEEPMEVIMNMHDFTHLWYFFDVNLINDFIFRKLILD